MTSDAYRGLVDATSATLPNAAWLRSSESTNAATSLPSPNGRCAPTGPAHGFAPGAPSLARAR